MRILMVGHPYVVGLNRNLCRAVAEAGGPRVEVTVAAPQYVAGDLRPIHLENVEGQPYRLVPIPARFTRVPHLLHYGKALGSVLHDAHWDVIHVWEEPYVTAGWQIARAAPRSAALVFSTFQNLSKTYPPPFNWMERSSMVRASGWTAFGQTIEETLCDRPGYRGKPRRRIPLGVDLECFHPDPQAGAAIRAGLGWVNPGPLIIGYLGRFIPEKGLSLLMRVLDRLPRGTWRALFIGAGPLEAKLREWAAGHPDEARVMVGVRHDQVPNHLNAMDVLAAPSQTTRRWREQFGRMLLEAMACGVPVVASDSGEIPHVVGVAGRIVAEDDEDAWVAALGELIITPEARAMMRERGLNRAHTVFAWSTIGQTFLEFFVELAEGRAPLTR
jgi:glycosyltransferase involved in cell wall biosynthesis